MFEELAGFSRKQRLKPGRTFQHLKLESIKPFIFPAAFILIISNKPEQRHTSGLYQGEAKLERPVGQRSLDPFLF